jgi:hypothetical protein
VDGVAEGKIQGWKTERRRWEGSASLRRQEQIRTRGNELEGGKQDSVGGFFGDRIRRTAFSFAVCSEMRDDKSAKRKQRSDEGRTHRWGSKARSGLLRAVQPRRTACPIVRAMKVGWHRRR